MNMRYLLCALLLVAACNRSDTAREPRPPDTTATPAAAPAPAPTVDTAAIAGRLAGTWQAQGYDSGSTRAQRFTITWTRLPAGGLTGEIAFRPGEKYAVKVVSLTDSSLAYESEPHKSPTLKAEVVTRTEARLSGDSLMGTYEARATEGKVLRGRFTARRSR
jgi:hypothetical protein